MEHVPGGTGAGVCPVSGCAADHRCASVRHPRQDGEDLRHRKGTRRFDRRRCGGVSRRQIPAAWGVGGDRRAGPVQLHFLQREQDHNRQRRRDVPDG